jgi:cytoplasmic polyadenylation element-binding protein
LKKLKVQIRPWSLGDSEFVIDGKFMVDQRRAVFVGGVPRPLKACELALAMNDLFGGVCSASIDTDSELKYPKGAGRVVFSNQKSYVMAIKARFVQLKQMDQSVKRVIK